METRFESGDPNGTALHFPTENTTVDVGVERLGDDRYRLTNFPIGTCESLTFGDVIEARTRTDGTLEFVRRVERSPFKTYSFVLPKTVIESEAVAELREHVSEIGGYSERVFGGMLLIAVPRDDHWDPTPDIERLFTSARPAIQSRDPRHGS